MRRQRIDSNEEEDEEVSVPYVDRCRRHVWLTNILEYLREEACIRLVGNLGTGFVLLGFSILVVCIGMQLANTALCLFTL
ncbi:MULTISPECIES: hypothetical protein [Bacillaceae]|uniref:Uncharacterized protein n=1 Tax=Evansella alkalicola TaxID=745819 RepID=A0ABS6JZ54_9BACI|nr:MULTISPECIES: hypothetical protein [Bacillaceae]MBU9723863.1 hypothetical protein [Bacillus alkalicola]